MSGKKGKKMKGKTLSFQEFLGDTPTAIPSAPKVKSSWADDEEDDDYAFSSRMREPVVLPTAPRGVRDNTINEDAIPTNPPFVAYISNLPYDVDEEDLAEFFQEMTVSNMRLPKDATKYKGYGYVEFEDRKSLIDALSMIDTNLKGRRVRIELSTNSNEDRGRGRMGRMGERGRDYGEDPERTTGDWRSARASDNDPPGNDGREDRYRSRGGFDRNRDDNRDSGFEDHKPGAWRDGPRDNMDSRPARPSFRDNRGGGPGEERGGERDWNRFADRGRPSFNRDGSRERDGERGGGDRGERSSFGPRRNYNDDLDKDKERWVNLRNRPRESALEPRESDSNGPPSEAPKTRPKLSLQPRTKPVEQVAPAADAEVDASEGDVPARNESAPVPAANIFGAAKPVDTAAKEREIEERLAKSAEAAAARAKEEADKRAAAPKEPAWGRRNGEGRDEQPEEKSRPTWRSSENRNEGRAPMSRDNRDRDLREQRDNFRDRDNRDVRGGPPSRGFSRPTDSRGPPRQTESRPPPDGAEREKKVETEEEELSRMPKAKDDHAPNFVASNKYSMLPDDVDPDLLIKE